MCSLTQLEPMAALPAGRVGCFTLRASHRQQQRKVRSARDLSRAQAGGCDGQGLGGSADRCGPARSGERGDLGERPRERQPSGTRRKRDVLHSRPVAARSCARGRGRVGLDGTLLEGDLPPIQGAVVAMHTAMYADHPDVGCVLHTHSPYATAYAVAHRPIGCWVEALAMFGLPTGVPVASYGPRGSDQAVANIRAAITPGVPAVLLANHGVLVFHRTPELAIVVGGIVEEAAQAGINAGSLGGPVEVPEELRAAALQRAMTFEAIGTVHA